MISYNNSDWAQHCDLVVREKSLIDEVEASGFVLRKSGDGNYSAKCIFHDEKNGQAFSVYQKNGRWLFKCHGKCNQGGDVIHFVKWRDGINTLTACQTLGMPAPFLADETTEEKAERRKSAEEFQAKREAARLLREKAEQAPPTALTLEQVSIKVRAACRLYRDKALQQWLADQRGWKRETISSWGMLFAQDRVTE